MKHTLATIFLLFLCTYSPAQNVKLDIITDTELAIENVHFFNIDQKIIFIEIKYEDSVRVEFDNSTEDGYNIHFEAEDTTYRTQFWLDTRDVKVYVKIEQGQLEIEKVIGSETYYTHQNYLRDLIYTKRTPEEKMTFLKDLMLEHSENAFSVNVVMNYLIQNLNNKQELFWLKDYMDNQSEAIKGHILYKSSYDRLQSILDADPLSLSDYQFVTTDRELVKISPSENKQTILEMWFVNCPPCIRDHKLMVEDIAKGEYNTKTVEFIGISVDTRFDVWKEYLKKSSLNWENVKIDYTQQPNLIDKLGVTGFPTYLVLSSEGKIIKSFISYEQVREYLVSQ